MIATHDIRPITQLKTSSAELIREVAEEGRTLVITQHGEAKAVLMGAVQYDQWRQTFALLTMLGRSKAQHRAGKHAESAEVFERLEALIARAEQESSRRTVEPR
ncbi:MAG TPA: type II toxin-antitoxin system Phd/YefM family antitoxin [Gemmatimonadaceae bacterium]|jgi:prevent-host-death family protein|nr:type II toxin-antitoxin system Phd/YefM family antitoxin [Gemmatimonadaceae bacterium]